MPEMQQQSSFPSDMEDLLVIVLASSLTDQEKVAFSKEIIDAFTRRGHFNCNDYPNL
jgi:hypothetical protein